MVRHPSLDAQRERELPFRDGPPQVRTCRLLVVEAQWLCLKATRGWGHSCLKGNWFGAEGDEQPILNSSEYRRGDSSVLIAL